MDVAIGLSGGVAGVFLGLTKGQSGLLAMALWLAALGVLHLLRGKKGSADT